MTDLTYNPHKPLNLEDRRRRLSFRAWHRGIKELDLIFGNFTEANLQDFGEAECEWFESLFEENDQDILKWVTDETPDIPERFQGEMMDRVRALDFMTLKAK